MPKGSEVAEFIWYNDAFILMNNLICFGYNREQIGQYDMLFNLQQTLWHVFFDKNCQIRSVKCGGIKFE